MCSIVRILYVPLNLHCIIFIRSTPPGRPNKVDLKCPSAVRTSVRPSVRPQKVSSISMKFGM